MVKNVSGGNKAKSFASKNFIKKDNVLRVSQDEAEMYAQVTKIYGGSMCQVKDLNGTEMLCHIRGKFKGRGKRDNFICNGSWLLVGLREWENKSASGKKLNCDVIEVYNESDKTRLKNNVTSVNWLPFISNDTKMGTQEVENTDEFVFADEATQEYQTLIESHLTAAQTGKNTIITTDDGEFIDVDDI